MIEIKVTLKVAEDGRCGNCRFYDDEGYRCVLFDKELKTERVPKNKLWAYYKPIRCAECKGAEVKNDEEFS